MSDFAKEVWGKLSVKNVNDNTEKKGRFTYLSWVWAWSELCSLYPESTYKLLPLEFLPDGSCTVWCELTVAKGDQSLTHSMWLPVMDHKNNAIQNPNAMDINKARMRCLVKCISMFGLGLYIYAGEDLPEQPEPQAPAPIDLTGDQNRFDQMIESIKSGKFKKSDALGGRFILTGDQKDQIAMLGEAA